MNCEEKPHGPDSSEVWGKNHRGFHGFHPWGGKEKKALFFSKLAQAFTRPPTQVISCQQFCFSRGAKYVPSENPASLLLRNVHPNAWTAFEMLDLAESHWQWFSSQNFASVLVARNLVHRTLCFPSHGSSHAALLRHSGSHFSSQYVELCLKNFNFHYFFWFLPMEKKNLFVS